jgi:hypothetical protein
VIYPDGEEIECEERQPMGHPLSFPLLCITNLSVYRYCVREQAVLRFPTDLRARRAWIRVRIRAVVVNGDDMLFKCDRQFYDRFIEIAKSVGLKISIGKNYLSPDMCMINSQTFRRSRGLMQRVGYLNLKFVSGGSLKGGPSNATPDQIGVAMQKMIKHAPWTSAMVPDVFRRWSTWRFLYPGFVPNWYLPVHLGGFGLRPNPRFPPRYTREQRIVAHSFVTFNAMHLVETNRPKAVLKQIQRVLPEEVVAFRVSRTLIDEMAFLISEGFVEVTDRLPDDWWSRFRMMAKAHAPSLFANDDIVPRARTLTRDQLRRFAIKNSRESSHLRPFTELELEDWRETVVYARAAITPPQLLPIPMKSVREELRWIELEARTFRRMRTEFSPSGNRFFV